MYSEINIENAISSGLPIVDVRSPGEYKQGHIPGAINIPLFSDEERARVGTVYKQKSEKAAIELGYKIVNPKLDSFVSESLSVAPEKKLIVHCWRGGMRSNSFAQHLSENGFTDVKLIAGGYKAYRSFVSEFLSQHFKINLLGGYTGSGKTYILKELKKLGHQVLDLEGIAHHKGSAFGSIGEHEQPTTEMFENYLFNELRNMNSTAPIWVEDENINIGKAVIPAQFFSQMQAAKLYFIDIPMHERAKHLVNEYTNCDISMLADPIMRISKRLGDQNARMALQLLESRNFYEVALISLSYYDKAYLKVKQTHDSKNVIQIPMNSVSHYKNALEIEKYL
jgi:tRNA 2-selenouridine synthase